MSYTKADTWVLQQIASTGLPLVGGSVSAYITGTTTPLAMYTDSAGNGSATSFTLNSLGMPQSAGGTAIDIYLDDAYVYKFIIRDSLGVAVGPTIDPVYPSGGNGLTGTMTSMEALRASSSSFDYVETVAFYEDGTTGGAKLYRDGTGTPTGSGAAVIAAALAAGTFCNAAGICYKLSTGQVVNAQMFGADPTGVTECAALIYQGILFAIANDVALYIPGGTYLCDATTIWITFAGYPDARLKVYGDGKATTLIQVPGTITTNKTFFRLAPSVDVEMIEIADLVLDSNARNQPTPVPETQFEQSHTLRFIGASGTTTRLLYYRNVIIKDPVADGMNNQGSGIIENWVIDHCAEIDRTRTRSSIQQSYMAENLVITGFVGARIESEPVATITTEKKVTITGCVVDRLDFSGGSSTTNHLVTYRVSSSTASEDFFATACRLFIDNSELSINTGFLNNICLGSKISDTTFKLAYDDATGALSELNLRSDISSTSVFVGVKLDNCDIEVDYPVQSGALPTPVATAGGAGTGYGITGSLTVEAAYANNVLWEVVNCTFDARLGGSVFAYRNGRWKLRNNKYACHTLTTGVAAVYHLHGGASYACSVTIDGGDFTDVVGYGLSVANSGGSAEYHRLIMTGTHNGEAASRITKTSGGNVNANNAYTENSRVVVGHSSLPSQGMIRDRVMLNTPTAGTGWIYAAAASSETVPAYAVLHNMP